MKPNWKIILCSVFIVAATFSIAVLEGANAVARDSAAETQIAEAS